MKGHFFLSYYIVQQLIMFCSILKYRDELEVIMNQTTRGFNLMANATDLEELGKLVVPKVSRQAYVEQGSARVLPA